MTTKKPNGQRQPAETEKAANQNTKPSVNPPARRRIFPAKIQRGNSQHECQQSQQYAQQRNYGKNSEIVSQQSADVFVGNDGVQAAIGFGLGGGRPDRARLLPERL